MNMKGLLLAAVVLLVLSGCGSDPNHPFFKPEISGANYAAPLNASPADVKALLDVNIRCYGPQPCIDMDGTFEGWGFVDDGAYYAAPKIDRLAAPSVED